MALKNKYQQLIDAAQQKGVTNLKVRQEEAVLYIDGHAPTQQVKQELWDLYNHIDPDFRSGDLVMNINTFGIDPTAKQAEEYTVQAGDSLSKIAQRYPGLHWQDIYDANRDVIKDPDLIHPGWKLKIPAERSDFENT